MSSNPKSGPDGAEDPLFPDEHATGVGPEVLGAAEAASREDEPAPGAVTTSGGWLKKVKPLYVMVAAVIVWTAWILGADYFQSSAPVQHAGYLQPAVLNAPAGMAASTNMAPQQPSALTATKTITPPAAVKREPAAPLDADGGRTSTLLADETMDEDGSTKQGAGESASDEEAQRDESARERRRAARPSLREIELQAKVTQLEKQLQNQSNAESDEKLQRLQSEISAISEKLAVVEKKLNELPQKPAQTSKAPRPKPAVVPASKPSPAAAKAPARASAPVAGFRLNTVYSNQAWIDSGDRTYIVQVGDRLGSARVTRIDAKERRVYTDAGVIK